MDILEKGIVMKKYLWLLGFILPILVVLSILFPRVSPTYIFPNPVDEIVSIDLIINMNKPGETEEELLSFQRSLTEEEIQHFMDEIYELKTEMPYPPPWGWGRYIAKVTYDNGDIEMLGSGNIEYVENGSVADGCGTYTFYGYGVFEEIFLRYLEQR